MLRKEFLPPLEHHVNFMNGVLRDQQDVKLNDNGYETWLLAVLKWMFDECQFPASNMIYWSWSYARQLFGDNPRGQRK